MSKISSTLAISLMVVSGIVGIGIGYGLTPEYRSSMYEKGSMDLGKADRRFDLRYINAMIAHHRAAILLAEKADGSSQRPEIKELAKKIRADEPALIQELYDWKQVWYNDTRTVQDPAVATLGTYDDSFDLRFLNALIAHHEAGIEMTGEARIKSSRTEILNNADAVEAFLETTLPVFEGWRKMWYGI